MGFEARGHGKDSAKEAPATVLNSVMTVVKAGGNIGIPGLYVTGDPGAVDEAAKVGSLSIRIGLGWAKSCCFTTGQCPVMRSRREAARSDHARQSHLRQKHDVPSYIKLDDAPKGYVDFDKGAAKKFVIDPHKMLA